MRLSYWRVWLRHWWRQNIGGEDRSDTKVMVLEAAKTLYIPIPKAANTSARRALCTSLGIEPLDGDAVHRDPRIPILPLSEALMRAGEDWFIFTIVRDPLTRAQSAYRNKVVEEGAQMNALRTVKVRPSDSFEQFITAMARWPRKMLNDHFMPQSMLLSRALADPRLRVFHVETLGDDWPVVQNEIVQRGGERPTDLGIANATLKPAEKGAETEGLAWVLKLYGEDYKAFGYAPPTR
ncbi:MAG: sulfotransferase family 2 domain-containing protein [Pseudomonadota bacterium]